MDISKYFYNFAPKLSLFMKKHTIFVFLALICAMNISANDYYVRCVAFYNLENLFDTIHDEGKNDYEYLPDGGMHWTSLKY